MKALFLSAPYIWSDDRTRKLLNKIKKAKANYTYFDWKFKPVKTCPFLTWRSISKFLSGFGRMILGKLRCGIEYLASSVDGLILNYKLSKEEPIALYDAGDSNSGYQWEGLVQMVFRSFRANTIYFWIFADVISKALIIQPALRNQNSITFHTSITPHIPSLINSALPAEEPGLTREITS